MDNVQRLSVMAVRTEVQQKSAHNRYVLFLVNTMKLLHPYTSMKGLIFRAVFLNLFVLEEPLK
jgi:hypothetical protein